MTAEQSTTLMRLAAFAAALLVVFVVAFVAGRSLDPIGDPEPTTPTQTDEGSRGEQHDH